MTYVIEADATADAEGTVSLPKMIGPFQTADHARIYMSTMFPRLWGSWGLAFMESPDYASRLSTRPASTTGSDQ